MVGLDVWSICCNFCCLLMFQAEKSCCFHKSQRFFILLQKQKHQNTNVLFLTATGFTKGSDWSIVSAVEPHTHTHTHSLSLRFSISCFLLFDLFI